MYSLVLLQLLQVFGGSTAPNLAVSLIRDGGLVYDRVEDAGRNVCVLTPLLREDVMDIDTFLVAIKVDHASLPKEVLGSAMLDQDIKTAISG